MEARREKLLTSLFELRESHASVIDHKEASTKALELLGHKRRMLQETVQFHRIEGLEGLVNHVLEYLETLEASIGTTWALVDDHAEKTSALVRDVANLFIDTHASLLRRTIAINVEYELKRQLLLIAGMINEDEEEILRNSVTSALKKAKKADAGETESLLCTWFPNSDHSLEKFRETMQLLKVASAEVHPTTDIDGKPVDMATMTALINADFDIPQNSRQCTKAWETAHKMTALHYVEKLVTIREAHSS